MRSNNAFEAAHGSAAVAFLGATLAGWTIQDWAAFAALLYTLMLIAAKAVGWIRDLRHKPPPPPPAA